MVIRTQKITRPRRMLSRSRLNTPATPSRQGLILPTPLTASQRTRVGHQQVEYVDHEGGVHQKRHDHAYKAPAVNLDGIRQVPAVEQDEECRVEEHHEPAPRRGEDQKYKRLS